MTITRDSTTIGNCIYPLVIGSMEKGVSDIKLFDIKTDGFSFPLGLRTVTQPLDKYFEEKLDDICFPKTKQYLKPYSAEYNKKFVDIYHDNMGELKDHVIIQLELYHRDRKKVSTFKQSRDFKATKTPDELLVVVLQEFGQAIFESVFPRGDR